jgi:hypothetical protein
MNSEPGRVCGFLGWPEGLTLLVAGRLQSEPRAVELIDSDFVWIQSAAGAHLITLVLSL